MYMNNFIKFLSVFGICGKSVVTFLQTWRYIQRFILLNNNSQLNPSVNLMTDLIDQEKYFYLIMLHALAATYIGTIAMMATGTTLLAYLQHICGMFSIAR